MSEDRAKAASEELLRCYNEMRRMSDEISRLKTMAAKCVHCQDKTEWRSRLYAPKWATGPDWKGWKWWGHESAMVRFSTIRQVMITEDFELVIDDFGDRWERSVIDMIDPQVAVKIANIIVRTDDAKQEANT